MDPENDFLNDNGAEEPSYKRLKSEDVSLAAIQSPSFNTTALDSLQGQRIPTAAEGQNDPDVWGALLRSGVTADVAGPQSTLVQQQQQSSGLPSQPIFVLDLGRPDNDGPQLSRGQVVESAPAAASEAEERDNKEVSTSGEPTKLSTGAYTLREEYLMKQERAGEIAFKYVENNGDPYNMMYLIGLKNIFSKQLPNMPKEYICRLVLDRRHRSVALVKRNHTVVGGITYRAFHQQAFGEIAFCAITSSEQVKGYGTRLMNYTKDYARTKDRLTHFLTYADNNAVGYFAKQGFTKEVTLERERWLGYIKDYDGGTLMECILHTKITYTGFPDMIRAQRLALDNKIRAISNSHVVRKGLDHFTGSRRRQIPIESISGVKEAGWVPDTNGNQRYRLLFKEGAVDTTPENLQRFMAQMLAEVQRSEDAWPFRDPVSKVDVPDYYDVIKDPVDLQMIERRLKSQNYYLTLDIFAADFKRMFDNCRYYNASDTIYYKIANKLEAYFNQYLSSHLVFEETKS